MFEQLDETKHFLHKTNGLLNFLGGAFTIEELEKIQSNQKLPGLEDALPTIEDKMNPEKIEGNLIRERIVNLVETNPAKAAQVVHEMIHAQDTNKEIA